MTLGAGHNIVPELVVQEALVVGLHKLVQDEQALDELVSRVDTLYNGSQDTWTKALRDALREMLDPSSQQYVRVTVGYPRGIEQTPALAVVLEGGGENVAEALCGDEGRRTYTLTRTYTGNLEATAANVPDTQSILHRDRIMETGQTSTLQVSAWTTAPERSLLLQAAAKWALFHQKGRMAEQGIHEITWRAGGVEVSPDFEPRISYLPMLILTINWTYRETRRDVAPNRVTLGTPTFSV